MLHELFSKQASRKARAVVVRDMVDAMNTLDYVRLRQSLADDAIVIDAGGRKLEGADIIIENDRAFREQADRPQVEIETLDHSDDEILVRGTMHSGMPEIDGPIMWRIEFDGRKITRVEVTRPRELMTAPLFAKQMQARRVG